MADFFFVSFARKTYCNMKMFLVSNQSNFYLIMSSYVEGHVEKSISLNFMSLVGFQTFKIYGFFWKTYCRARFEIIFRQKNGLQGIRHSEMQNISGEFSFAFLSCHYGFMNCFKKLNFVFSNIIPRGVLACKILPL